MVGIFNHTEITRHGRDLGRIGKFFRFNLIAHGFNRLGVRADENNSGLLQRFSESRALREEAITGVNRFRARLFASVNNLLNHEIGLRRGSRSDEDSFISHFDMKRVLVRLRIDRDRLNPHTPRSLDDPARDFATICDQDFLEHARRPLANNGRVSRALLQARKAHRLDDLPPKTGRQVPPKGAKPIKPTRHPPHRPMPRSVTRAFPAARFTPILAA